MKFAGGRMQTKTHVYDNSASFEPSLDDVEVQSPLLRETRPDTSTSSQMEMGVSSSISNTSDIR